MSKSLMSRALNIITHPQRIIPAIARRLRRMSLSQELVENLFDSRSEIDAYRKELLNSGLLETMNAELSRFDQLVGSTDGSSDYGSGVMSPDEGVMLYAITRKLKPASIVETGVCSGYSTAIILQALHQNAHGRLYSIDYPEVVGEEYAPDAFWEGKGNAVVPPNKQSGWIIPNHLRDRWSLHLGKSQDLLPPLLKELKEIDIFIHDSEHSYECMMFEYRTSFDAIRSKGLLISDDILWNTAFFDFARGKGLKGGQIGGTMGVVIKP